MAHLIISNEVRSQGIFVPSQIFAFCNIGSHADPARMAGRVGMQHDTADSKDLFGAKEPPTLTSSLTIKRAINSSCDHTAELSMKAPMWVSKPADLG